jgi:hypothetical protein
MVRFDIHQFEEDAKLLERSIRNLNDGGACARFLNKLPMTFARRGQVGRIWERAKEIRSLKLTPKEAKTKNGHRI